MTWVKMTRVFRQTVLPILVCSACLTLGGEAQEAPTYQELHRPQFHFSPPQNWMNDPNGLIYFDGEYHLFYQHNPFGKTWGHMSWGHAVSKDLVHWVHLPVALPETKDRMAFSGCVVLDENNTSGLGKNGQAPLVAVYTGYRQSDGWQAQYLATSLDRGRTWQDYSEDPVLDISSTDFRDPNVFWYKDEWRMVVALPTERKVQFYSSQDLKSWTYLSEFGPQGAVGGAWECPDLFPMQVEGEDKERWILQVDLDRQAYAGGSGGQYFVGDFDGERFTLDQPTPAIPWPDGRAVAQNFEVQGTGLWKQDPGECGSTRKALGRARSELFKLDKNWLNLQLRGGRHPGDLELRLRVDGRVVRRTTGYNGSHFQPIVWDVSPWRGKQAQLELYDQTTDLWGYLEIGGATLSDRPASLSQDLARWIDFGPDYYACISFHNLKERRVWLAWMNNWLYGQELPTSPWRSAMSVPRELTLRRIKGALELCQEPVKELKQLRHKEPKVELLATSGVSTTELAQGSGDLTIDWKPGPAKTLSWRLLGLDYTLDLEDQELRFQREGDFHPEFPAETVVPLTQDQDVWKIRLLYDQSSVELFTQQGTLVHTARVFPTEREKTTLRLQGDGGEVRLVNWGMRSIW